jgi:hypothetical protein
VAAVVLSLQLYSHVSLECDWYGRARKRVLLLLRKAFSKTTLNLTPKGHPTPKLAVLRLCVVGNNEGALHGARQIGKPRRRCRGQNLSFDGKARPSCYHPWS